MQIICKNSIVFVSMSALFVTVPILMIIQALLASLVVATVSLIGVLFFGRSKAVLNGQRYVIPVAVGVFLSLVLFGLIPKTVFEAPVWGGVVVGIGFILFYILAGVLHKRYHRRDADTAEACDRKGSAMLLLIGDAFHNIADGIILGGAFLISPVVGVTTAVGLVLHELPQEIVEFGVLLRAGYSRTRAALYNFLSASSILIGTISVLLLAEYATEWAWVLTGLAAGNLLYIAASDLLPRIHGSVGEYGGVYRSALLLTLGFIVMTGVLAWSHAHIGHGHDHGDDHGHVSEHADEHVAGHDSNSHEHEAGFDEHHEEGMYTNEEGHDHGHEYIRDVAHEHR